MFQRVRVVRVPLYALLGRQLLSDTLNKITSARSSTTIHLQIPFLFSTNSHEYVQLIFCPVAQFTD